MFKELLTRSFNLSYPITLAVTIVVLLFYAKAENLRPGVKLMVFGFSFFTVLVVVLTAIFGLIFWGLGRKKNIPTSHSI